jgi:hypothetical protein
MSHEVNDSVLDGLRPGKVDCLLGHIRQSYWLDNIEGGAKDARAEIEESLRGKRGYRKQPDVPTLNRVVGQVRGQAETILTLTLLVRRLLGDAP